MTREEIIKAAEEWQNESKERAALLILSEEEDSACLARGSAGYLVQALAGFICRDKEFEEALKVAALLSSLAKGKDSEGN